jgi:hypothetical protein
MMRSSPLSDLRPLVQGLRFLWRHPLQTLGLALLTVVLSFLGPVLQIWAPLPDDPSVSLVLALVAMIPLELYFMPRFILALDAEALDHPLNPWSTWKATFEARWLAAFLAKAFLYLFVGAAATCLLVPGLIVLALFGWGPWRVLLRGETLKVAAKVSATLTTRHWARLLLPFAVILGVYLTVLLGALWFETRFVPDPVTPWVRLTHPAIWTIDFGGGLLNLWLSATCLALYHSLEVASPAPAPPVEG